MVPVSLMLINNNVLIINHVTPSDPQFIVIKSFTSRHCLYYDISYL